METSVECICNSYGPFLTAGAILLSAISALVLALLTIQNTRRIARKQLAFRTFSRNIWDKDFMDTRREFVKLCKDGDNDLAKWASKENDASKEVTSIKSILNDFETIANGIESGILDERFYFNQFRGALISDFNASKSFIMAMRNRHKNDQYFIRFENLASRWRDLKPGKFPQITWCERLWDGH